MVTEKTTEEWIREWLTDEWWDAIKDNAQATKYLPVFVDAVRLGLERDMDTLVPDTWVHRMDSGRVSYIRDVRLIIERRPGERYIPFYVRAMIKDYSGVKEENEDFGVISLKHMRRAIANREKFINIVDSPYQAVDWVEYEEKKFFIAFMSANTCYQGLDLNWTLFKDGPAQAISRAIAITSNAYHHYRWKEWE